MIDFSLYCDIKNAYYTQNYTQKNISASMIIENQYDDNAVAALIKKCDKTTLIHLIDYFDDDAPIQALLKKQLAEINVNEKQMDIEETVKNSKRRSFYQYLGCNLRRPAASDAF